MTKGVGLPAVEADAAHIYWINGGPGAFSPASSLLALAQSLAPGSSLPLVSRLPRSNPALSLAFSLFSEALETAKERRNDLPEQLIQANGVELCTEPFGDPADPPILLIQGVGASMLWWEEGFCRLLAEGRRFVIRYDHRDTGRSVTYEPDRPEYTAADLVADAVGVLDAYGIPAAHVVGVSAGGALAQLLALDFADRVVSLVLISTSPATPGDRGLPLPTEEFGRFLATAEVDWSDAESVIEYNVGYSRILAGGQRTINEAGVRELVRRDVERARNFASAQNHDFLPDEERSREPLSSIIVPTLVIHGTADPMFPVRHGEALADELGDARLLTLKGAGHGIDRSDWDAQARAILAHTHIEAAGNDTSG